MTAKSPTRRPKAPWTLPFICPLLMAVLSMSAGCAASRAPIPPGEVRTYGDLARSLGSGPRAVAGALRANPWPLLIPCHRIVGHQNLGGYCGHTDGPYLGIKRWLLLHEGWR